MVSITAPSWRKVSVMRSTTVNLSSAGQGKRNSGVLTATGNSRRKEAKDRLCPDRMESNRTAA